MVMIIKAWEEECGGSTTCTTSDQLGVWTNAPNIVGPKHQIELLQGHWGPSSQTTRTLVRSRSQPTAHIPILAPGQLVKMEEGRTANSVLVSSIPPLDDFGEQPRDRYLWETIQGLGGRRLPLPDMKLTLEHFIMSEKEKLVFTVFFPKLFIWKLSNLQKNCNSTMDAFQLNSVVNSLLPLLSPFLSLYFSPHPNPLKISCRH